MSQMERKTFKPFGGKVHYKKADIRNQVGKL